MRNNHNYKTSQTKNVSLEEVGRENKYQLFLKSYTRVQHKGIKVITKENNKLRFKMVF